ncbi:unnamed protein product [Caenorhabditis sp. 36 PRJEB53466]|nr:unnamed protein product [Caenorhabditis sp. 36 PRJEB53466]
MKLATVLSLLVPFSGGAALQRTATAKSVECDLEQLSECTVTCGGGFMLMKYACPEPVKVCECPTNPIYYQCNNRPCLSQNATLLDKFYDAEDQQAESNELEFVDENEESAVTKKNPTA